MNTYSEQCAALTREALALPDDAPLTLDDLDRFAEAVPGLTVRVDPRCRFPQYEPQGDGRGSITLPPRTTPEAYAHEIGHHLRGDGLAAFLTAMAHLSGDVRLARLARSCTWQEEAGARAFVIAVFLPPLFVLRHTDYELAERVPWSRETIRARRRELLRWAEGNPLVFGCGA